MIFIEYTRYNYSSTSENKRITPVIHLWYEPSTLHLIQFISLKALHLIGIIVREILYFCSQEVILRMLWISQLRLRPGVVGIDWCIRNNRSFWFHIRIMYLLGHWGMELPLVNLLAISLLYLGVIKVKHVHSTLILIDRRSLYVLEWLCPHLWFLFKTMCYGSKTINVSLDSLGSQLECIQDV